MLVLVVVLVFVFCTNPRHQCSLSLFLVEGFLSAEWLRNFPARIGRSEPREHLPNTNCPEETDLRVEYLDARGPKVALGPLPSARLRLSNSPCGVLSPKTLERKSGLVVASPSGQFWEGTLKFVSNT